MKQYIKNILIAIIISLISVNYIGMKIKPEAAERKVVYLTFDDGPSFSNTDSILDLLCKNNVKATFCVVGNNAVRNKGTMRRINSSGMGILPHCNNHDYTEIYSSTENYVNDLNKCMKTINGIINEERTYNMVRMPGGSTNTVCTRDVLSNIKSYLKSRDINYIDWTIDCGDTRRSCVACNTIKENVEEMCGKNIVEVVLMHDLENKKTTTEALQGIIDDYKRLGYEFKTIESMEPWEFDYLINRKVINR
ncbi:MULTISPECIES: polysaccharide deacetylase family protein [Clostridium]|jgi:peptidoglycan/xylan/chitin deacetylase (PgdA/CDA1 family)|uniref:Peptidoglycan N-acetylglucosamine deacetylase n=1 Tax=Clostridium butyricum E4 str. BoNT E BL5262 TaxID=632245 RepID=C4II00_CLOBU|nr:MULTISPECIES: polysaccharide deacetylase family protein [Clostridium]APF24201.1 polysaccharide deacetylase family protein [Clostridium butyricum]EDT76515.1 peptidoglycan N-acetylglucosamine deacetylase [Clostridium butyricum 5521]EEP54885.1 peptidoglycan N-acetylglucosamine deacetylase [Clostridium butyricum E4 str. BoNT E BL5262]KQB77698.1 peptidoglycan N-acetylglucosamine deacetylase [Clostridium butyricum]MBO1684839.1 polysaccharide deacetylase [Clostridium butyricum]